MEGKERKFKIYVDIDPTDHFPLFYFTVKGNLSIFISLSFITLFKKFIFLVSDFLACF